MKEIYLDYAASAPVDRRVIKVINKAFKIFGNPSSLHSSGLKSRKIIEKSRLEILKILGDPAGRLIFTGSGTEANNLAILGIARAYKKFGNHLITSKIEHPSVLNAFKKLETEGFDVAYLNVDRNGIVKLNEFKKSLQKNTILVSVMYANNEIGTIQPISEIARIISNFGKQIANRKAQSANDLRFALSAMPLLHIDAIQAFNYLDCDIEKLSVDLMTLNGSKIYGPKGIGCLYLKKNVKIEPLILGGEQEFGLRPGTENTANIAGFGEAIKLTEKLRKHETKRLKTLRDWFIKKVQKIIPKTRLNGHSKNRLPNNINFSFADIEGESLVLRLDALGIRTSTGSACSSERLEPSHVILALGAPPEIAHGSLRITLGRKTTKKDLEYVLEVLLKIVEDLRRISPIRMNKKYMR
jgi:cysteine desulfurase